MTTNRELHKIFKSGGASFYLADFHVHSPASADIRLSPRFEALLEDEKSLVMGISKSITGNPVEYESATIKAYPPETFFKKLAAQRDKITSDSNIKKGNDWAIIAITDHNVCKYATELSSYALANLANYRIIILPGIELTVNYPVPPENQIAAAHLLCIFAPSKTDSEILLAIASASGNQSWMFGHELVIKDIPEFVKNIRNSIYHPCLCIAAHVGSSAGVREETKQAMLSRIDAEITRIQGELAVGLQPDFQELSDRIQKLQQERDDADQISMEILKLIGLCGFDALQVRGRYDETHYRQLHRFREDYGRAVPIVCSDAHRVEDIFKTETGIPHIKLSDLSAKIEPGEIFKDIKEALRLGETRFSFIAPERPMYWISGIQISPDASDASTFWPFEDKDGFKCFTIALSRNLNCIIGGRGSGKSAALEALAFIARPQDFDVFQNTQDSEIDEFYSRSKATISGCKLTLCWQFMGYRQLDDIPKHLVFASRYFDPNSYHETVKYSNIDGVELLADQVPDHSIQYFRLGDIEKQTGPEKLRRLFDRICGKEIMQYEARIQELISNLGKQRALIVNLSERINRLTADGSPLRAYVNRKRLFDEVNSPTVREKYEEVDPIKRPLLKMPPKKRLKVGLIFKKI